MSLATDIKDRSARIRRIQELSANTKAQMGLYKAAILADFPLPLAPWLMSAVASLFSRSRLVNAMPPLANVVISNVAGIPVQLYFADAKVVSYYPVSIVIHGMALNVTVQSYNGRLDYGLIGYRRALPDINELADALLAEHRKLLELALALAPAPAVACESTRKKTGVAVPAKAAKPAPRAKASLPAKATKPVLRLATSSKKPVRKNAARVAVVA